MTKKEYLTRLQKYYSSNHSPVPSWVMERILSTKEEFINAVSTYKYVLESRDQADWNIYYRIMDIHNPKNGIDSPLAEKIRGKTPKACMHDYIKNVVNRLAISSYVFQFNTFYYLPIKDDIELTVILMTYSPARA